MEHITTGGGAVKFTSPGWYSSPPSNVSSAVPSSNLGLLRDIHFLQRSEWIHEKVGIDCKVDEVYRRT